MLSECIANQLLIRNMIFPCSAGELSTERSCTVQVHFLLKSQSLVITPLKHVVVPFLTFFCLKTGQYEEFSLFGLKIIFCTVIYESANYDTLLCLFIFSRPFNLFYHHKHIWIRNQNPTNCLYFMFLKMWLTTQYIILFGSRVIHEIACCMTVEKLQNSFYLTVMLSTH